MVAIDPLVRGVQQDAAYDVATAATNMAVTVDLLTAALRVAGISGADAGELRAAIETMSVVRDSLHEHAATLANAGCPPSEPSRHADRIGPTAATIRQTLTDLYGTERATATWSRLLAAADIGQAGDDSDAIAGLARAMLDDGDPLLRLCGRSVQVRLRAQAALLTSDLP